MLGYDDLDDVIIRANDSEFGLGRTIFTSDVEQGIERLEDFTQARIVNAALR